MTDGPEDNRWLLADGRSASIARITPFELSAIAGIYNVEILENTCTFEEQPWDGVRAEAWLAERDNLHPAWVIWLDGRVAGWCGLSKMHKRSGYRFTVEPSVYVDRSCQRLGLGRRAAGFLIDQARRLGYHTLVARICTENQAGLGCHLACGYRQIGLEREVGFKFGRWLDVAILQKMLNENE